MKTALLTDVQKAADLLIQGELVAFPTETVYGLGAPLFMETSLAKIFEVKRRPIDNPLIVHISALEEVELLAKKIPKTFFKLASHFFPGPLTLVLEKHPKVPLLASANLSTIAIRWPKHPLAQKLIQKVGMPLAAPSANLSGKPSSTTAHHVLEDFDGQIAAVLDGGSCDYGLESTVLSLLDKPTLLRPGTLTKEEIESALNQKVEMASGKVDRPIAPGMKYRHYSPKAPVLLFDSKDRAFSHIEKAPALKRVILEDLQPKDLYAIFRKADQEGIEEILILLNPSLLSHVALMNRLEKAAIKKF